MKPNLLIFVWKKVIALNNFVLKSAIYSMVFNFISLKHSYISRLVVAGSSMTENSSGPKIFRYDQEYGLSQEEVYAVYLKLLLK